MAYHGVVVENFHAFQMSRIRRCTTITTLLHFKWCRSEVVYAVPLPCGEAELATPDMDTIQKYSKDRWRIHVTQVATSAAEHCNYCNYNYTGWNLWFCAASSHCQVLVSTVCKPWRRLTAKMYKICSFRHSNARPWQWKNCKPSHALLRLKSTIESCLLAMWCFRFLICLQCDQAAQHAGQARRLTRSSCHQNNLGHDPEWWCVLRGSQEPLATSLSSCEIHPSAWFLCVTEQTQLLLVVQLACPPKCSNFLRWQVR